MSFLKHDALRYAGVIFIFNFLIFLLLTHFSGNSSAQQCVPQEWPAGSYCIFRAGGTCPPGFNGNGNGITNTQPGIICFDTEDDHNRDEIGPAVPEWGNACSGRYLRVCCK